MWLVSGIRWLCACASAAVALGLLAAPGAAAAATLELITRAPETLKSYVQWADGWKVDFAEGTTFQLEVDAGQGSFVITDYTLPPSSALFGNEIRFIGMPATLSGYLGAPDAVGRRSVEIPAVMLDFSFNREYFGTLELALTTGDVTIPGGCAGRQTSQTISGSPLDPATGEIALVGAVCPYSVRHRPRPDQEPDGPPWVFDEAFRIFIRGSASDLPDLTVIPEPGSAALLGAGLLALACGRRSRR